MWRLTAIILLAAAAACGGRPGPAPDVLTLLAPASPGGGWDQTARAMQAALQEDGAAGSVRVVNVAGAGGTIGLAHSSTPVRTAATRCW